MFIIPFTTVPLQLPLVKDDDDVLMLRARSMPMSPTKSLQRKMLNCCDRREIENQSMQCLHQRTLFKNRLKSACFSDRVLHQPPLSLRAGDYTID